MTDQSTNIPWTEGMNYGMGVNLLNGDIAGKAVDPGVISAPTQAGGQATTYNLSLINSIEELYSSIGLSVEASGHYGLFNASGKYGYAKESKFNSQSTFLLARCVVENAFTQAEDVQIRPDAASLIEQGKITLFQQRYGDGFVRGMQTGGEFFAIISITSSSREDQKSIAASLQAKYGGLFASAQVDVNLDETSRSKIAKSELRISTFQRGGSGDEQSLTADIEEVMARLKAFPAQVKNSPVPYDVQVASYNTVALPEGPSPVDIRLQKDSLIDYERIRLKLLTLRNDIEFLQLNPNLFVDPPGIAVLNKWQDFVENEINEITRQASHCLDNPKGGCETRSFRLPEDFRQVKRRTSESIEIKASALSWPEGVMKHIVNSAQDFTVSTRLETRFKKPISPFELSNLGILLYSETADRGVWLQVGVGDSIQRLTCGAWDLVREGEDARFAVIGVETVPLTDDQVYLRMSKKGDQLLDLSYSHNGHDWNSLLHGTVDLTQIGFPESDTYELSLFAYSMGGEEPVAGNFYDLNVINN